jgi:putative ABC transport system permease protein
MFSYYIKTAWRSLLYQKFYTGINITGLGIGLAGCFIIVQYVLLEESFDRFHQDANRIYKLNYAGNLGNGELITEGTPPPLAATLEEEFPEVEMATRIYPLNETMVRYADKSFNEDKILATDADFFKVFSYPLMEGSGAAVLSAPNALILTESTARKYFGDAPVLGKVLQFGEEKELFTVRAVVEDPPYNSHLQFSMLRSIESVPDVADFEWSWIWNGLATYVKVAENTSAAALEAKFPDLVNAYAGHTVEKIYGSSLEAFKENGRMISFFLQPLADVHLHSAHISGALSVKGDIKYLYIFSFIAFFIILLACINFINLSTARAARRGREVGVRKVMGSSKKQLILQFLTESLLTTVIAVFLALVLSEIFIHYFAAAFGLSQDFTLINESGFWAVVIGLVLMIGFIAGSYPAFYLSSFQPVEVLSGKLKLGISSSGIRNLLVVLQFAVSICLIICTALVFKQLNFLQERDLGLNKENVLVIANADRLGTHAGAFREALGRLPAVKSASISRGLPSKGVDGDLFVPGSEMKESLLFNFMTADDDFLETLSINLKEGRSFSRDFSSDIMGDENAVIINEAAAQALGWEKPLGKYLISLRDEGVKLKVVGVAKDFHFRSLHDRIEPLVILPAVSGNYMSVKLQRDYLASVESIEKLWEQYAAVGAPFEHSFLEENFNALYTAEQRQGKIFLLFTCLVIFIACLGLLGLSAYATTQRTKELGIRKVLGSSTSGIVQLLSSGFIKLVIIANIIAWPLAWYAMDKWLQSFAYKTAFAWWIFLLAGLGAFTIALLTVSLQSWQAATQNPVKALRYE